MQKEKTTHTHIPGFQNLCSNAILLIMVVGGAKLVNNNNTVLYQKFKKLRINLELSQSFSLSYMDYLEKKVFLQYCMLLVYV